MGILLFFITSLINFVIFYAYFRKKDEIPFGFIIFFSIPPIPIFTLTAIILYFIIRIPKYTKYITNLIIKKWNSKLSNK